MCFEIEDLVGLKEPLLRLIEVVSAGIGNVYRLVFARAIAHGETQAVAEKIRQISCAATQALEQGAIVKYKDANLEIAPTAVNDQSLVLPDRAHATSNFIAEKRQKNFEAIAAHAALDLLDKESVPNEKPDEDWISRFFSAAQDISSSQMQELWGRILAGEIQRPGSYSLRTLDFVRNLTKADAKQFERLTEVVVYADERFVLFAEDLWYKDTKKLTHNDFLMLAELGIIMPSFVGIAFWEADPVTPFSVSLPGNKLLYVEHDTNAGRLQLSAWKLTKLGNELFPLSQAPFDIEFARFLGRRFRQAGRKATLKEIVIQGNSISFSTIEQL